jgi:tRNA U54 and U55 pseudouridine synthase Pus10
VLYALPHLKKCITPAHALFCLAAANNSSIEYRAGVKVEMRPRPVTCHSVECVKFSPPSFTLEVHCSGGFYVRSLVHDLGNGKERIPLEFTHH